jgi:predicted phosphodiesterase
MRLLILSDLHRELWRSKAPIINTALSNPDVIILAGDIDTGAKAVSWAAQTFADLPVLYVHGNHEGYGKNLDDVQDEIRDACTKVKNVHFLNCSEHVIGMVRFLGATLWTDFKLFGDDDRQAAMREAEDVMTDYKRIRLANKGYRKLRAADTAQYHAVQVSWLSSKLSEPFPGKTIVITHMAPSLCSVPDQFSTAPTSAAYASRLDPLVKQADFWIHGHMHESFDYLLGNCRVLCNPCGYISKDGRPENREFDPNFIVDLPDL